MKEATTGTYGSSIHEMISLQKSKWEGSEKHLWPEIKEEDFIYFIDII